MSLFGFRKREVGRIANTVRKSEGPAHNNGPGTLSWKISDSVSTDVVVVVKSYSAADSPAANRWVYVVRQMKKTAAGIDGWVEITDEAEGLVDVDAFNWAETINVPYDGSTTSPTILGNGIDVGRVPAQDFDVAPAPVGRILPAKVFMVNNTDGTQTTEVWFDFNNQLDGECA